VKVLFIAGTGRSGTTLLGCMLGQLDGFFAAGEVRYLWRRGLIENRACGCGVPFCHCDVWRDVVAAVLGTDEGQRLDPERLEAVQRREIRARRIPAMLMAGRGRRAAARSADAAVVQAQLSQVYRAVTEASGCRVIVDTSKLPTYGRLLDGAPGVELYVVHVVRDPRATAFSWQRWRELPDGAPNRWMQRQSAMKSAYLWLLWNCVAELFWRRGRYLRVRYDDLVMHPQLVTDQVLRLVGEPTRVLPFEDDGRLRLEPTHTVAGNPGRLGGGAVRLVPDSEWQRCMRRRDRWLVAFLTLPAARRYGFALRPEPMAAAARRD
jgi:hypothetical protein